VFEGTVDEWAGLTFGSKARPGIRFPVCPGSTARPGLSQNVSWLNQCGQENPNGISCCGLGCRGMAFLRSARPASLRLSVHFLGYTNITDYGNPYWCASRSPMPVRLLWCATGVPQVVSSSPSIPVGVCSDWMASASSRRVGAVRRILTQRAPLAGLWFRGERLGDDSYGIGRERRFRAWRKRAAFWLQDHGIRVPRPVPQPLVCSQASGSPREHRS